MSRLHDLYENAGQSPWLDNLRRDWITNGHLAELVASGVRGVTSNPTIFAKAIEGEHDYDEQFKSLTETMGVEEAYWELVIKDIVDALSILRPVYDESEGVDGFVSLEVSPSLAHDAKGTIEAARGLHDRVGEANLYVKIPATIEGLEAIRQMISEGRSINVTLIFGIDRYDAVAEAYIAGLEEYAASGATDLSKVSSVASFFVSRVDTEIDRRLSEIGAPRALLGRAAVAQAKVAYEHFKSTFSGPRWEALVALGARRQRPLWASTSTKNPAYPDLIYVDSLIGKDTVNTMPDATLDAFIDHGTVTRSIESDLIGAEKVLNEVAEAGIDFSDVASTLEAQGVASFEKSFTDLLATLKAKLKESKSDEQRSKR
jgi:transaldolase